MMDFSKKQLVVYITAGFPDMEFTQELILKLQAAGVGAIEIGVPYTDPVADGPVIALAAQKSLARGTNLDKIFDALEAIKDKLVVPLYLMSYYSPVYTYGEEKFIERSKKAGVTGSIIPDLALDEGKPFFEKQKKSGIDPILLVFPNTDNDRIKEIAKYSGSFIYYVNLFGTTGERATIPESAFDRVEHVKVISGKPVCAGFGVSGKPEFDRLSHFADGVIIGSAVVKRMIDNEDNKKMALQKIEEFVHTILSKQI